jgi:hypothetical protein
MICSLSARRLMPSIHEQVLKEKVDQLTTDDPNWRLLLFDVLRRFEDGF